MTIVPDVGDAANYDRRVQKRAWPVYRRLMGYALHYKGRLAVSVLFAIVVAGSFSTMIFSVGAIVQILFEEEAAVLEQMDGYGQKLENFAVTVERYTGAEIPDMREWTIEAVKDMRRPDTRGTALRWFCVGLTVLALVGGFARFLQEYFAGAIGAAIAVRLNRQMFDNLLTLSHRFYEGRTSGDVVTRFTNDAFMVNRGLANVFVKFFREPIKAVFFLGMAFLIDVELTLVVLLVLPPVIFVIHSIGKRVKKSVRSTLQKVGVMAAIITETVQGITVVKGFGMEDYERSRLNDELSRTQKHLTRMVRADAAIGPATEFLMVLALVAFLLLAERQISSGDLSVGALTALSLALAGLLDPLRKLSSVNNMVQTSVASAERVFEFIDMQSEIDDAPDAKPMPPLQDSIRFQDVAFGYDPNTLVLDGLDLTIGKGEMVALVGFSGAGKSTVAKLIPRFYDVDRGRITIDGTDIRELTLKSLRAAIGIVTQETILFHETIRGNIAFGRTDFSDATIRAAAAAANAAEFIEPLPKGYDTFLGDGGSGLSGGQRQRLAIARAVIKDPALLILDEATSSLDARSERAIQQAIDEFVVGRTTLVIAHRLSTIQRADRIVVIDGGRVAEEGTHEELLARGGIYQRLYEVQFAPREESHPS